MSNYTTRLYRLNDAQLSDVACRFLNAVKRDWSDFSHDVDMMSVFKAVIVAENAMRSAMDKFKSSVRFSMGLEISADELRKVVHELELETLMAGGVDELLHAQRRMERLSNLYDTGLLAVAIALSKRANYFAETGKLSEVGLRALEVLKQLTLSFEKKLKEKVQKQLERALADEECAHVGNLLFDRLMFLSNLGKRRYFMCDWEKYQDYLMPDESNDVARLIILINGHQNSQGGYLASGE